VGWLDTQNQTRCSFAVADDVVTRCLPFGGLVRFADSACTAPVLDVSGCDGTPLGRLTEISTSADVCASDPEPLRTQIYRATGVVASVNRAYTKVGSDCVEAPDAPAGASYVVAEPVEPTRFISAETSERGHVGGYRAEIVRAEDGAEELVGLVDEKQRECTPRRTSTGDFCVPIRSGRLSSDYFADATCQTPLAWGVCERPHVVIEAAIGCDAAPSVLVVESAPSSVFENTGAGCVPTGALPVTENYGAPGVAASAENLSRVKRRTVGERAQLTRWVDAEDQLLSAPVELEDGQTGQKCSLGQLEGEDGLFCIPQGASFGGANGIYADIDCTQPLTQISTFGPVDGHARRLIAQCGATRLGKFAPSKAHTPGRSMRASAAVTCLPAPPRPALTRWVRRWAPVLSRHSRSRPPATDSDVESLGHHQGCEWPAILGNALQVAVSEEVDLGPPQGVTDAHQELVVVGELVAVDVAKPEVAAEPQGATPSTRDDGGVSGVLIIVSVVAKLVVPKNHGVIEDRAAVWVERIDHLGQLVEHRREVSGRPSLSRRVAGAERVERATARAPIVMYEVLVEPEAIAVESLGPGGLHLGHVGVVVGKVVQDLKRGAHTSTTSESLSDDGRLGTGHRAYVAVVAHAAADAGLVAAAGGAMAHGRPPFALERLDGLSVCLDLLTLDVLQAGFE